MTKPRLRKAGPALRAMGGATMLLRAALLVVILTGLSAAVPNFTSPQNIYALLQTAAFVGLVALGLSLTMIAGEFDLSVGSMVAVGGLITLKLGEASTLAGVGSEIVVAALVGLANAAIVARLRTSSLVVTVGTMMALSGFAYWLADGKVVSTDNFEPGALLDDPISRVFSIRVLITFAAYVFVFGLMRFTRSGRDIQAIGSNRAAASASGVRVGLSLTIVFGLSAISAALAGSLLSLSLATATAGLGANVMLQAASAAIIGGVALSGGVGGPFGVLVGVFILATLNNGLSLLGASAAAILFTNGLVLLAVVLLDGRLARDMLSRVATRRTQAFRGSI